MAARHIWNPSLKSIASEEAERAGDMQRREQPRGGRIRVYIELIPAARSSIRRAPATSAQPQRLSSTNDGQGRRCTRLPAAAAASWAKRNLRSRTVLAEFEDTRSASLS